MPAAQRASRPSAAEDRRGALRHPVTLAAALSPDGGAPLQVTLVDISERGCRIRRPDGVTADSALMLGFGGYAPVGATVAWTSSEAMGLRFDQPVHPALIEQVVAAARGRRQKRLLAPDLVRREERERLWHLKLWMSFQVGPDPAAPPLTGTLCDLSVDGCRIVAEATPLPGSDVRLLLGLEAPVAGRVQWSDDHGIGIAFAEPLPPGMVARIARGA